MIGRCPNLAGVAGGLTVRGAVTSGPTRCVPGAGDGAGDAWAIAVAGEACETGSADAAAGTVKPLATALRIANTASRLRAGLALAIDKGNIGLP